MVGTLKRRRKPVGPNSCSDSTSSGRAPLRKLNWRRPRNANRRNQSDKGVRLRYSGRLPHRNAALSSAHWVALSPPMTPQDVRAFFEAEPVALFIALVAIVACVYA